MQNIILDALTTWVGKIPVDVVEKMAEIAEIDGWNWKMAEIAPMLRTLGKAMKGERRRQGHLDQDMNELSEYSET